MNSGLLLPVPKCLEESPMLSKKGKGGSMKHLSGELNAYTADETPTKMTAAHKNFSAYK
jgi:hypothetical protein